MAVLLRKFRLTYFFSFVTAVLYGYVLDGARILVSMLPADSIVLRAVYFTNGTIIGLFARLYDRIFEFKDGFALRKNYE